MKKRYVNSIYDAAMGQTQHTAAPTDALINISDAAIAFDEHIVLQGINMKVRSGELVYIIGRVGSGKSSLLKAIYAEVEFDEGEAVVNGFNLNRLKRRHIPELRRSMGIVFQDYSLLQSQTVHENLDFVLRATGWNNREDRIRRIDEVLDEVGLRGRNASFPHELSGGEQQRVAIARALLNSPRLILADEPTGNLDATTARGIIDTLQQLTRQGASVVLVTHNMSHLKHCPGRVFECSNQVFREIGSQRPSLN